MAEQIVIAELQINTKALQDSSTKLIQEIAKLRLEQSELKKSTNNLSNATDEQSRAFIENDAKLKQLTAEYSSNKRVLAENTTGVAGLNEMLSKEVSSISDAEKANKKLSLIRSQITTDTKEGRDAIDEINKKIDSNNTFIDANSDRLKQNKNNIGGYSEGIKRAYEQLDIFNGGIGGFISRSQEAGGTGNLLKEAFSGISQGIVTATKASLGFIATPLGAIIAIIALSLGGLYVIFKSFAPVVDRCEQAMAAIGAVFNVVKNSILALVTGTKSLTGVFSNLGGSMSDAADQAVKLKKAQQDLEDQQEVLEVQSAKASRQINEYLLKSKDRTLSEQERIDYLKKAQQTEEDIFKKKESLINEEVRQAQQKLIVGAGLTAEEIRLLKEKGVEYAKILQDKYALDDADISNLKDALVKKENVLNDSISIQEKAQNKVNALYEKADDDREKAQEKAQKAKDEAIQKDKEAKDKKIEIMNDELSLFIAKENVKAKTVEQSIEFEEEVSKKRLDILGKELEYGKISKAKYEEEKIQIEQEAKEKEIERTKTFEDKKRDLQNEIDLQNAISDEEKTALKLTQDLEAHILELEDLEIKETQKAELKKSIIEKYNNDVEKIVTEAAQKKAKIENEFKVKEIEFEKQKNEIKIDLAQKIGNTLIGILGDSLGAQIAGIAFDAIIQIAKLRMTTAAAQQINLANATASAPPPLNLPLIAAATAQNTALGIASKFQQQGIIASSLISAGGAALKKLEKGGLQEIGGKRHSAGGTKFVGEDGTTFEAEQGELVGVMNRNAAKAFMDFNDNYPSGANSNVFANGGIATAQSFSNKNNIDYDLLASKISQANLSLPAPSVQVAVTDINYGQNNYARVIDGANH